MERVLEGIELNEDFVPNHNILYDIFFDGHLKFEARLSDPENKRRAVSFEDAPKVVKYVMDKPLDEFTKAEIEQILQYRGLTFEDGFEAGDVFMEFSYVKQDKNKS